MDLRTENGIMADVDAFFRNDPHKHRCVPSPRNQRIESWWGFLRRTRASWWMDYLKDLEPEEVDQTEGKERDVCPGHF